MEEKRLIKLLNNLTNALLGVGVLVIFMIIAIYYLNENPNVLPTQNLVVSTIEISPEVISQIGFIDDTHVELVITNCISCHSSKLVTQNRANKEGWRSMIRWMQRTQNLQDLGNDEEGILEYLSKNYAPTNQSRRANLKEIEWYKLD